MDFFWFVVIVIVFGLVYRFWRDLGTSATTTPDGSALRQCGPGDFDVKVVGESHYQDALRAAAGLGEVRHQCDAMLVLEDDNRHDPNAVRVDVDGRTVGYLSRDNARLYRAHVKVRTPVQCAAVIVSGGHGRFLGVWLYLPSARSGQAARAMAVGTNCSAETLVFILHDVRAITLNNFGS